MMRPRYFFTLFCLLALAACGTTRQTGQNGGPTYKVGEPYQIDGTWYYPHEDYSYDETGIASWYGQDFHGQHTANGEIFNKNELTAAHKTLPLPTLARVTNLENGKSIVVRINDRGPFSGSRLIDLSQRGAQLLGFENQGTAKVRVQVLADESKAIADAMRHYGTGAPTTNVAANAAPMPIVNAAPLTPVSAQPLDTPSPESAQLEPIKTTAAVHQALLNTKPVQEVEQLPVTGSNQIYVQAGAFSRAENANALKQKLSRFGKATVTQANVNGQTFFRVRVGPISDVQHADAVVAKIGASGISKSRIVIE